MEFKKRYLICIAAITLLLSMATIFAANDISESMSSSVETHNIDDNVNGTIANVQS